MKNSIVCLFCVVLLIGCGKFDDTTTPVSANGFTWNLNGTVVSDSIHYLVNEIVLAEVIKDGQKITAEVDFGNGDLPTFGDMATGKYKAEGVYKLTATVKSVTPVVKITMNVVIGKKAVVVVPSTETVVVKISGSFAGTTNTMIYGLNISNLYGYDPNAPIYVEASVPGKDWSVYTNATEIVVINGFKYVKWPVSCPNGNIRVGWYQYKTNKDGLKVKSWAGTSESGYYNDGLPEFSVYNGENYKLGTAPVATAVYTMKANDAVVVSGSTIKIVEGTSLELKVYDASGNLIIVKYDNDGTTLTANAKSIIYSTAGTYKVTATVGTTVIVLNVEVSKVVVISSESIILISSSLSGTTNSLTLGLRCDAIIACSTSLNGEAQGEMPGADWKSYSLLASEITTVNGIQYFQWKISCANGKVRFGWLQGANWASDMSSSYRQTDGLYVLYVKDTHIYNTVQ